jgi:hypothetical protein
MHLDNKKSKDLGRKPPDGNELDHWGRYWPDYWGVNIPKSLLLLLSIVIIDVFIRVSLEARKCGLVAHHNAFNTTDVLTCVRHNRHQ